MPMPPPKPTTEGRRDRHAFHEMGQIMRALRDRGPQDQEELSQLVGAQYWEKGRFERALAFTLADGLVVRTTDGKITPV
jgi:hypothetical protein